MWDNGLWAHPPWDSSAAVNVQATTPCEQKCTCIMKDQGTACCAYVGYSVGQKLRL